MLVRMMLVGLLLAAPALAQEQGAGVQGLPEAVMKKLQAAPDAFLQDAAGVIYGFGTKGSIDAAGLNAFVAAERAKFRAREMARYLAGDLDNDGAINREEVAVLAGTLPAGKRGRLQRGFDQADTDANKSVSLVELRGFAQGVAMISMSEADAAAVQALLLFDLDRNGAVAMEEVAAGVGSLLQET